MVEQQLQLVRHSAECPDLLQKKSGDDWLPQITSRCGGVYDAMEWTDIHLVCVYGCMYVGVDRWMDVQASGCNNGIVRE